MATAKLINNIFLVCLSSFCLVAVNCSRADLGTYLHIKELPGSEEKHSIDSYVLAYINYTYNTSDGREMHVSEDRARYGEGKIMNVQGTLVHVTSEVDVNDHTACSPVVRGTRGMPLPGPGKPWIALVKRGTCTFEEKIKHVYRYRAVGVIVYNEESSVSLEKMKINDKERNITAIFTYKVIGEQLARILEDGTSMWVSITEGQRGMKSLANINKTSVLFVSISFIVLMIISLVWLIFYYVQRFRYLQSKDQHSRHLCTVAKRIIMKIPTKSGKCEDKDSENDCCAICIELYKATDCIRVLPCKHEFHKNCIDPWLLEHRTCPMCKLDVLKHYGFVFLGSEESILQLDLDIEIGDGGLHSSEDDRLSIDNIRVNTTPTFHIQNFGGRQVRSSSLASMSGIQREDLSERSQSSLSRINHMLDESIASKLFVQQSTNNKESKISAKSNGTKFLNPEDTKRDIDSISLPGTLQKFRTPDSCRGSNNCYMKATADLKQLASKIEKGCPKSRTTIIRHDNSDDEYLLANERNSQLEAGAAESSVIDIKIQVDDVDDVVK